MQPIKTILLIIIAVTLTLPASASSPPQDWNLAERAMAPQAYDQLRIDRFHAAVGPEGNKHYTVVEGRCMSKVHHEFYTCMSIYRRSDNKLVSIILFNPFSRIILEGWKTGQ